LTVDVEERMYAAGKIPGGFFKREGRATDKAILISRLTDRPLRPLFDKNLRNEVQSVATVISVDQINPYDVLIVNGASTALYISDIPFNEPIGAVRIAKIDKEWVVNPTYEEINKSIIDIVVAGTEDAILMVEAKGMEAGEEIVVEAIERAQPEIKKIILVQKEFREKIGIERRVGCKFESDKKIALKVKKLAEDKIKNRLERVAEYADSEEREQLLNSTKKGYLQDELKIIENEVLEVLKSDYPDGSESIKVSLKEIERDLVREMIINKKIRPDGRKPDEIRKITCEVGLFPETTHGTGLFTRGRTQALTILALGSIRESQRIDSLGIEEFKRFMHHYNFLPYSTGETWPLRGPKRREIGHGALAEKALKPMIPDEEKFPYSLRLVSEILESNGSTSMASVCGCTLYGDMDFKVAGTKNGITALQMDIKVKGINIDIIRQALEQAREGRLYILQKILDTIPASRKGLSKIVPKIITFKIPRDKIGEVIGPGGKNIKSIKEEFKLDEINVDDSNGEGIVSIISCDDKNIEMAKKNIKTMIMGIEGLKEGEEFLGTVVGITSYGAFVNLIPGLDGLLHISKISDRRIDKVEDVLKIGEKIDVKIDKIDKRDKKVSLKRVGY
jgi:polyribonucleotide nucleotidyltransferase